MAPPHSTMRHRRTRSYDPWSGRHRHSFNRRLSLNTFREPSERDIFARAVFSRSRPLLPRNHIRYGLNDYSRERYGARLSNEHISGSGWRDIVWNALRRGASNISSEFVNVVTANIVEFGVAVVTAYVSNYIWT